MKRRSVDGFIRPATGRVAFPQPRPTHPVITSSNGSDVGAQVLEEAPRGRRGDEIQDTVYANEVFETDRESPFEYTRKERALDYVRSRWLISVSVIIALLQKLAPR